ncbi:hypothetical protein AQUCO_01300909v1 [Aquilegia coerulea]|uniref:pectinesterase n=1 Tax=Aquilegia coerulea TaxID=218851 RepID=A0A2G5E405_AQUCA|nr:hypothetical protein AQUCO_01300909v1 [Aquilegia coerulea]
MDSINTLKGYDKVVYMEDPSSSLHKNKFTTPTPSKRKFIIILISTIILSTVFICLIATTLIHHTTTKSNNPNSNSNSIRAVCNLTNYLESCTKSLQNSNTADPEKLLEFSLQVSLQELTNLSSLPQKLLLKVNDPRVKSGLIDCESLFTDAVDSLNSSISLMKVGPGEKMLSVQKINDIKTWVSAAMTNLETCLDGLDEMNSSLHDEMVIKMKNSKEYTSNSLAIVAKIETLLDELHIPMH